MLQDMTTINRIKGSVGILNIRYIHLHHHAWIQQVRRDITYAKTLSKPFLKTPFRCDMQQILVSAIK